MNSTIRFGALAFVIILGASAAFSHADISSRDETEIRNIEKRFSNSWLKNDEEGVLSLFWQNAALYPNGRKAVKGIDEIRRVWFSPRDSIHALSRYETELDEVYGNKRMAFAIGTTRIAWTSRSKDSSKTRRFSAERHFISIYEKRKGTWKILRRHWNGKLKELADRKS